MVGMEGSLAEAVAVAAGEEMVAAVEMAAALAAGSAVPCENARGGATDCAAD